MKDGCYGRIELSWCLSEAHSLTSAPPATVCVCVYVCCVGIFHYRVLLLKTTKGNTATQMDTQTQPC